MFRSLFACCFLLLGFAFTGSVIAQERTAAVKDELRERFTQEDYENYLKLLKSGEIPPQGGPVNSIGTADVLVNNNNGSIGTARFTQSETDIIAFGNFVVIGFNDAGSYTGTNNQFTGWAYSTDGGATFTDGGTFPTSTIGDAGDPVLARNETTGRIYLSTLGFTTPSTIQMWRSDDNGVTWMPPVNATPGGSSEDKQWHVVDNFPGPGNGNVYMISRRFGTGPGIYVFRSTDHGSTFSPSGGTLMVSGNQGAFIAVGMDHSVYAFWWTSTSIQMRKSTDFGVTFGSAITVASGLVGGTNGDLGLTGIRQGLTTPSSFRSNSFPHVSVNPVSGYIYVTYNNRGVSPDKGDIFLVQSTDGGTTWSTPFKVNDDATTTDQWQPTIAVTPGGDQLGIFYYSRQEDPTNNNLFKFYGRIATISGTTVTFSNPSFAVSDTASLPEFGRDAVVNSTYMGDYNHAVATSSAFHVVWSDNRDDLAGGAPRKDPNVYYKKIVTTENFGWVRGTITNVNGGAPLGGVSVDFVQSVPQSPGLSSATGTYLAGARVDTPGTTANLTLRARKFGFLDTTIAVTVTRLDTLTRNFAMRPLDLVLTKTSIVFPPTPAPGSRRDSLVARNQGLTTLTLSSLTTTNPSFSVSPTSGSIPPGDSVWIYVTYSPPLGGSDTGRVIILSNSVFSPRADVLLSGTAIGIPRFTANVDSMSRTLEGGARDSVMFRMRNVGTTAGDFSARAIMYPRTGPNRGTAIEIPMVIQHAISPIIEQPRMSDPIAEGYDPSPGMLLSGDVSSEQQVPQYYNFNTGGSGNTFPFNVTAGKRIQWLFLPGDFSQPSPAPVGRITRVYFRISTGGSGTYTDVSIKIGQTSITTFPPGDWYSGPMQTVYTRSSVDLSAATNEWVSIPLDVPFQYDPTQSLVVDITQCARVGTGLSTWHTGISNVRRNASLVSASCPMPFANTSTLVAHFGIDVSPGSWLAVAPTTGTLAIGDSILMTTRFDATDSATFNNPGNYFGRIEVVATNSSLADTLRIPVRLFVVPPPGPRISVDVDSVDFGNVPIGTTDSSKSVLVRNIGGALLTVTNITFTNPAFSTTQTNFSLASLDTTRVRLRFTAPTPGGVRTGVMNFVSNDALAPSVGLRGNSVGVSNIVVTPDSFQYSLAPGDSATGTLRIRNTGSDSLRYTSTVSGGYIGRDSVDIGSTANNLATSSGLMRGGVVQVTTSVQLREIRSWLNITAARELRYVVYENTGGTSYTKIFEAVVASSGTGGPLWYSSGPVNIPLIAGKTYAIGVNWAALSGLTYYWQSSAPVPVPIPFGSITGGLAQTVFPPPATITQGASSSLYYTQLLTSSSQWLTITSNSSRTVAPGDSTTLGFKVHTASLGPGPTMASLVVNSNDSLRPTVSVPVHLDVITGIAEQGKGIPEVYALDQNYPNPFNPTTTIQFALPEQANVVLRVFNILGQEVATLANGQHEAAYFKATWDGRNNFGNQVGTGVYFYRIDATGVSGQTFTSLKKMIYLK